MAAVETYATEEKEDGTVVEYAYAELVESVVNDFRNSLTLDDVLHKYSPLEKVSSLIVNEFPLLGQEHDPELLELYSETPERLSTLKSDTIAEITSLLATCNVVGEELDDFITKQDGMAFFQANSILKRTEVASQSFAVDFKRITSYIERTYSPRDPINIIINVSNRDFENEIAELIADGVISRDGRVNPAIDLIETTMPKMSSYFKKIKKDYSAGIGDLRHPLNDFQPTFVQRFEVWLKQHTKGIFTNLPELFLTFLKGSPVMKHFFETVHDVQPLELVIQKDEQGRPHKNIVGRIRHITLILVDVQNEGLGINSLVQNGLFFKLRTCDNIIASQIRGMQRYVPLVIDDSAEVPDFKVPEKKGKAKGGAKGDSLPFFDLYQGQLLSSDVSNQTLTPSLFKLNNDRPIHVSSKEHRFTKLEMEHIIGVYQAALLFKFGCYPMTIFANLQIMSHESNNGVASKPYIDQKLEFMLKHETVSDKTSDRNFTPRLRYFLARLRAMENCLVDRAEDMESRYLPYSSYKPGLEKIISCLTHGKAFEVIEATQYARFEDLQHKTRKLIKTFQTVSHDLIALYETTKLRTERSQSIFRALTDKLLTLKVEETPAFVVDEIQRTRDRALRSEDPLSQYSSFVEEIDRLNDIISETYFSHCRNIQRTIILICDLLGKSIRYAVQIPLNELFKELEAYNPLLVTYFKATMTDSLRAMKLTQNPSIMFRGILFTLLQDTLDVTDDLDALGKVFFDSHFRTLLDIEDEDPRVAYPERGLSAEEPDRWAQKPPTLAKVAYLNVVTKDVIESVKQVAPNKQVNVVVGQQMHKFNAATQKQILESILLESEEPILNVDKLITFFDEENVAKIMAKQQQLLDDKAEEDARLAEDPKYVSWLREYLDGEVEYGGGGNIPYDKEVCYVYDENEKLFNETQDPEAYQYLCKSWGVDMVKTEGPFMSVSMKSNILKHVVKMIGEENNDALNDIYLTHYDRDDDPVLKLILRMIYDYFTLQGIYVPFTRDERPLYTFHLLLAECLRKKKEYMSYEDCDEMVFDNGYANILCIQIFGQPITILINDLSNGKLPVPYGIQNNLCGDCFHPETFYVTFNVLKCIFLALPNCHSLLTYLSYLNILLGESFLHNMYTDSSFSLIDRIHNTFFDKIIEMQHPIVQGEVRVFHAPENIFLIESELPPPPDRKDKLLYLESVNKSQKVGLEGTSSAYQKVAPPALESDPNTVAAPLYKPDGSDYGGTRRYRRKKTRRQTLNKRFKKHRTRRLHGVHVRD